MGSDKLILVAPSDWGLGHSSRVIPLVWNLHRAGWLTGVVVPSSLKAFFLPEIPPSSPLLFLEGYSIHYGSSERASTSTSPYWGVLKSLLQQIPPVVKTIRAERKWVKKLSEDKRVGLVISDSRFGLWSKHFPSVYITHQLNPQLPYIKFWGNSAILTRLHHQIWARYAQCWVPDWKGDKNLSGELSFMEHYDRRVHFIGPLSRFEFLSHSEHHLGNKHEGEERDKFAEFIQNYEFEVLAVISGPEPHRSYFEFLIREQALASSLRVAILLGKPHQLIDPDRRGERPEDLFSEKLAHGRVMIAPHLPTSALYHLAQRSQVWLSRSGYSTLMDLVYLRKPPIVVPTPGQTEQEYLARRMRDFGWAVVQEQSQFNLVKGYREALNLTHLLPSQGEKEDVLRLTRALIERRC